jgi:transcriptional regulator with PAS, ATPase and Fis domain
MQPMIILTDAQVVELHNRIGQIQRLIENAQVIKTATAQPKTVTEQTTKAPKTITRARRARPGRTLLTTDQVIEIKRQLAAGDKSSAQIARDFKIHITTLSLIKRGKTWKDVHVPA